MSTNLPDLPDANNPELPDDYEMEDTDDLPDEEPHDSGTIAFILGCFGLFIGFFGAVSGIETGQPNLLYYVGGILMSMSAFLAIQTIRGGSRKGRTAAIFILVLAGVPLFSFWSSSLSMLFHLG